MLYAPRTMGDNTNPSGFNPATSGSQGLSQQTVPPPIRTPLKLACVVALIGSVALIVCVVFLVKGMNESVDAQEQMKTLNETLTSLKQQAAEAMARRTANQNQADEIAATLGALQLERDRAIAEKTAAEAASAVARRDLAAAEDRLKALQSEATTIAKQIVDKAKGDAAAAEDKRKAAVEDALKQQGILDELERKVRKAGTTLAVEQSSAEAAELRIAGLRKTEESFTETVSKLQQQYLTLAKDIESVAMVRGDVAALAKRKSEFEQAVREEEGKRDAAKLEKDSLLRDIAGARKAAAESAAAEATALEATRTKVAIEKSQLLNELQPLKESVEGLKRERDDIAMANREASAEAKAASIAAASLKSTYEELAKVVNGIAENLKKIVPTPAGGEK